MPGPGGLRRELRFWEAIALSIAIMAPTAAMLRRPDRQRIAGTNAANAFFYPGTIGVLSLLVAYIVTNVGALRYLFGRVRRAPRWQGAIPVIAIAFLGYTIYKNVKGAVFPYDRFPFVVAAWLLVGLAIVVALPGLARRIGAGLAREEGLADDDPAPVTGS
jgi:hypothetical protein